MDRTNFLAVAVATVIAQIGVAAVVIGLGFGKQSAPVPAMDLAGATHPHWDKHDPRSLTDALFPSSDAIPAVSPMSLTLDRSVPVHLTIPRVGIDTNLLSLGLNPDGTLQLPPDDPHAPAGWYENLASPGEPGPAVIVGHLDAPHSEAVFFNLGALRAGDHIWVTRADHSVAEFTVREAGLYPKESFPSDAVYGPSDVPVLRLITCGGAYTPTGYTQNVVVFAAMTGIATESERDALGPQPDAPAPPANVSTGQGTPAPQDTPASTDTPTPSETPVASNTPAAQDPPAPAAETDEPRPEADAARSQTRAVRPVVHAARPAFHESRPVLHEVPHHPRPAPRPDPPPPPPVPGGYYD
jgi:hypothetical protein